MQAVETLGAACRVNMGARTSVWELLGQARKPNDAGGGMMTESTHASIPPRRSEILRAVQKLRVEPQFAAELRAIKVPRRYGRPQTVAGYFDDPELLARAAESLEAQGAKGIYVTLNSIRTALLARAYNRVVAGLEPTTADHDITRRVWIPFDIDAARPAGVSADEEELAAAKARALDVERWLTKELGSAPEIWGFSGNGYHLLYRCDFPNNENSKATVEKIIDAAADKFSDKTVSVDRTVINAARIWKLYGTLARKGDEVPRLGRVHRRSRILGKAFTNDN